MYNTIDIGAVKSRATSILERLFRMVKEYGGVVAEDCYLSPEECYARVAHPDEECPWIAEYYGTKYHSWDEVNADAMRIAETDSKEDMTPAMRTLANKMKQQARVVNEIAYQNLAGDKSLVARLVDTVSMVREFDMPYYSAQNCGDVGFAHLLAYLYKYGPLSTYNPDVWFHGVEDYMEVANFTDDDEKLRLLAQCIVALQIGMGIVMNQRSCDPETLEEAQSRGIETNSHSAGSNPTQLNNRSTEAREVHLKLAYDFKDNHRKIGYVPNVGQNRLQQKGNCLDKYLMKVNPGFNPKTDWPEIADVERALDLMMIERPLFHYLARTKVTGDRWSIVTPLPTSEEARQKLVDNGEQPEAILKKHKTDGTWVWNYEVAECCPWLMISDDEETSAYVRAEWQTCLLCKNRVVFANSNPVSINSQAFVHVYTDKIREWTEGNYHSLTDSWRPMMEVRKTLTNMAASIHRGKGADGKLVLPSEELQPLLKGLNGNDKSKFDTSQPYEHSAVFQCCFLGAIFKPEHAERLKSLFLYVAMPQIMTYKGLVQLVDVMPSGLGITGAQDTYISLVDGLYDQSRQTGIPPMEILDMKRKCGFGPLGMGDDFQDTDTDGDDQQMVDNFADFGQVVNPTKSLRSDKVFEYLRMFSNSDYRVYYDKQHPELNILATHAPLAHMKVKVDFRERANSKSPCIDEISQQNRFENQIFHPGGVDVVCRYVEYTPLGMGAKPQYYVPNYNFKDWKAAGSPKAPSKFHVYIDSPYTLNQVAAKEAQWLGVDLDQLVETAWKDKQGKRIAYEDRDIIKVLTAIANGDQKTLDSFRARVQYEPMTES